MLTIVKFFKNELPGDNSVISRTLLKVGLVDKAWQPKPLVDGTIGPIPQPGEFWRVRILKETCVGMVRGCFIVHPLEKIDEDSIVHLVPGMYSERTTKGVLVITPRDPQVHWILPLAHKKYAVSTKNIHAIVVSLGGALWPGHTEPI